MANAASFDQASSTINRTNLTACERCRRRKKKCDGRLPQCRLCQIAGVDCVGYDAVSRRQVPRSYVLSLEQRIAFLEARLAGEYGAADDRLMESPPPAVRQQHRSPKPWNELPPSDMDVDLTHDEPQVTEATLPLARAAARPTDGAFTSLELAGLAHKPPLPSYPAAGSIDHQISSDMIHDLDASKLSLPTWEASQNLIKSYFQFANLSQPILYEPHFRQMVDHIYSLPRDVDLRTTHTTMKVKTDLFFVFEVYAVALLVLQKQDPAKIPTSVADRYHRVALEVLTSIGVPTSILGVQALLLVSQYFYHHPVHWDVWKSVGAAVRLAVEIGLHEEPDPRQKTDFLTLDIRRRTFWVAYAMDRNLAIALGKPTALADGAITVKFPSALEDDFIKPAGPHQPAGHPPGPKSVNVHLLRFRQIQSEMQSILRQKPPPGHSLVDIVSWRAAMHQRIRSWYNEIPRTTNPSSYERKVIENFDLTYYRALLYLYQPRNEDTDQDEATALIVADAVIHILALYRRFFDERRLTIYWQAIENLSAAGSTLLHSYLRSAAVQDKISRVQLQRHVQTCSSLLWAMVEHFPAFRAKRDIFDDTAAQVLASLSTSVSDVRSTGNTTVLDQGSGHRSTEKPSNIRPDGDVNNTNYNAINEPIEANHAAQQPVHATNVVDLNGTVSSGRSGVIEIATPSYADFERAAFDWDAIGTVDDDAFTSWL